MTIDEINLVNSMLLKANQSKYILNPDCLYPIESSCSCGCASFAFVRHSQQIEQESEFEMIADFYFRSDENLFGIFLIAKENELVELEVWSTDGAATPSSLPHPDQLFTI